MMPQYGNPMPYGYQQQPMMMQQQPMMQQPMMMQQQPVMMQQQPMMMVQQPVMVQQQPVMQQYVSSQQMRGQAYQQPIQQNQANNQVLAQQLRDAMQGIGCDARKIFDITKQTTFLQRQEIAIVYKQMYQKDLVQELKKELSGATEKLIMAMYTPRYQYWAQRIHEAISGIITEKNMMIYLCVLMGDQDFIEVSKCYQQLYKKNMYDEISKELNRKDYAKLIRGFLQNNSDQAISPEGAAAELNEAAKGIGCNEDVFIRIMTTSTFETYGKITAAYQKMYKKSLESLIRKEFSGKNSTAFLLGHLYMTGPVNAIAMGLNEALTGSKDDDLLVFLTACFSDYYKGERINNAYKYYGDLRNKIKYKTTGKMEDALIAFWGL